MIEAEFIEDGSVQDQRELNLKAFRGVMSNYVDLYMRRVKAGKLTPTWIRTMHDKLIGMAELMLAAGVIELEEAAEFFAVIGMMYQDGMCGLAEL